MDFFQLHLFLSVLDTASFTRTAEQFHITQPAVSYQMRSLEQELGIDLFVKGSRTASVTPAGLEYASYARQICSLEQEARQRMHNIAAGQTGHLSFGILADQVNQLSTILSGFIRQNSSVQISTRMLPGPVFRDSMLNAEYDIYIGAMPLLPKKHSYQILQGTDMPLMLFLPSSLIPSFENKQWQALNDLPFLSVSETDTALFEKVHTILKKHQFTPRIRYDYVQTESILVSVNAGIGFSILPSGLSESYHFPNVSSVPLEDPEAENITMIAFRTDHSNPAIRKFREYAHDYY